jgi:hypothetical protein
MIFENGDTFILRLTVFLPAHRKSGQTAPISPPAIIGRYVGSKSDDNAPSWVRIIDPQHPVYFRQLQLSVALNFVDMASWEFNLVGSTLYL